MMLSMNIQNFKTTWLDFKYIENKPHTMGIVQRTDVVSVNMQ